MTRLLTIPEAAEVLRTSVGTVRRLIKAGSLPAAPVGLGRKKKHWRIDPADIERYCASQQPQPKPKRRQDRLPAGFSSYV